jgi:hypothetical protein
LERGGVTPFCLRRANQAQAPMMAITAIPPTIDPAQPWNNTIVCQLLARNHLQPGRTETVELAADEWLLSDLLRELEMGGHHLRQV